MIFRLNGGPGDGQKVEVGGKHDDGRTVRFVLISNEKPHIYICPSEDDFLERQLFLTLLEDPSLFSQHRESYKSLAKKVMGDDIADWLYDPTSKSWNDWKSSVDKRKKSAKPRKPAEKKHSMAHEWHNKGHEA